MWAFLGEARPLGTAVLNCTLLAIYKMQRQVEESAVPVKECLALVDRVAASQELRRAARLRSFLLYVVEQTLKSGAGSIREQEIGAAVFGRPDSYDTGVDNIVRVNATELRKRLEHYFAGEGAAETTMIEIPRGSYAPVFRRRESTTASTEEPVVPPTAETALSPPDATPEPSASPSAVLPIEVPFADAVPHRRITDRPRIWVWQAATSLLLLVCLVLVFRESLLTRPAESWKHSPALRRFWSEFFSADKAAGGPTDIVLADTSVALAEDILQRSISLNEYVNYSYKRLAESPTLSTDKREALALVLERNNGSIGDFRVAQQLMTLEADPARLQLKFAREYTAQAARHSNLVLIGSRKSNPWVDLFAERLNFDFQYDPARHRTSILNHKPQMGEQATYEEAEQASPQASSEPQTQGYGVIACMPSLNGKGRVLILEGTDSQATAATGDFMTSEDALAAFERKLPPGPIPFFEVLLRTSQLSGTPLHADVVAYRVYPR